MTAAPVAHPPDADPPEDRWDFEPDSGERFEFDPVDDRKWEAFLLDDHQLDPPPEHFRPL